MELNLFCCTNGFSQSKEMLKKVDEKDYHIFVVPDRFAMSQEKEIFEELGIESSFNIEVFTLSRLATIMADVQDAIPMVGSSMLIRKIINGNKNLACFNKTLLNYGFAQNIYATINQLKSCKITPEQLIDDKSSPKLKDLALIYSEYEKCKQGLVDSADRFDLLEQKINTQFSNTHFYFNRFDSFTKQGYDIIKKLILNSKSVNISVTTTYDKPNAHIYLKDVEENLQFVANEVGVVANKIKCQTQTKGIFNFLEKTLFTYNPKENFSSNQVQVFEGKDFVSEINQAGVEINRLIKKEGYRFKDIVLVVPELESKKEIISNILKKHQISYYLDVDFSFSNSILDKFIKNAYEISADDFSAASMLSFIKSPLSGISFEEGCAFDDVLYKYQLSGKDIFDFKTENEIYNKTIKYLKEKLCPFIDNLNRAKKIREYADAFKKLLQDFDVVIQLENISLQMMKDKFFIEERINKQLLSSFQKVIENINFLLGEDIVSKQDFWDIFQAGLSAVKLSTVPFSIDSVFVGDCSKSIFLSPKALFICGASDKSFPYYQKDYGLISDNEIETLKNRFLIEPSIQKINERERFKAFDLILKPMDKLFISYNLTEMKSEIVSQLVKLITFKGKNIEIITENVAENNLEKMSTVDNAKYLLTKILRDYFDGQNIDEDQFEQLSSYFVKYEDFNLQNFTYENKYTIKENVFFNKGITSVSQIEKYYSCPFKHFIENGLKIAEREKFIFDYKDIGILLHSVAEVFMKESLPIIENAKVEAVAIKIVNNTLKNKAFEDILKVQKNKIFIDAIKTEAIKLCLALNYQANNSQFKVYDTEVRFGKGGKITGIKIPVENKIVEITGIIDRIDTFKNYFRIIDYKSGSCDTSLESLFYGEKIQLNVYQQIISNNLKLKPSGVYYFPIKKESASEVSYDTYKMKGNTLDDKDVILASDKKLRENLTSDIIEIKRKKSDDFVLNSSSKVSSEQELLLYAKYALLLVENACKNILNGDIEAKPLIGKKKACAFCPYATVCGFDKSLGNCERKENKVGISDFIKAVEK